MFQLPNDLVPIKLKPTKLLNKQIVKEDEGMEETYYRREQCGNLFRTL
jgi:hypothetical protein